MAHIGVRLQFVDGTVITRLADGGFELHDLLMSCDSVEYPNLGSIDPYEDRSFSHNEMSSVIAELRRLAAAKPAPVLQQVLEIADKCATTPRSYLVFVGD